MATRGIAVPTSTVLVKKSGEVRLAPDLVIADAFKVEANVKEGTVVLEADHRKRNGKIPTVRVWADKTSSALEMSTKVYFPTQRSKSGMISIRLALRFLFGDGWVEKIGKTFNAVRNGKTISIDFATPRLLRKK